MSDIGVIDGGDGGDGPDLPEQLAQSAAAAAVCLACGGTISGPYCSTCGQKNDDLRRSSIILAKDFLRDTFGFDSRMWRTLGLLAIAPGSVPKEYAHGRRSRFTPPVRLFLVVSFLFFLTIGLTNTLFMGLEVTFHDAGAGETKGGSFIAIDDPAGGADTGGADCGFTAKLRFFVKERDLVSDKTRMDACLVYFQTKSIEKTVAANDAADSTVSEADLAEISRTLDRVFGGLKWAVANPRAFNDAFNDWLPRVLLFMTPVLALILTLFLRRGVLMFDHLILAFYTHAAGFAMIGLSLILTQLGAPLMGAAAMLANAIYYVAALKRAYGRGWIKTLWTGLVSGVLYLLVFLMILMTITTNIVWKAVS